MLVAARSSSMLWMLCVWCTFLTQAPQAASFSTYPVPRSWPVGSSVGLCRRHREGGPRMSFEPDASNSRSLSSDEETAASSPGVREQAEGYGGTQEGARSGQRECRPGQVLKMRPDGDNSWAANRRDMKRDSTFIYALMYQWPTGWLRAERRLNNLARDLRDDPPPPLNKNDEEKASHEAREEKVPFDVPKRYRVAGKAGRGAFSIVRTARDLEANSQVAIKRVQDTAVDATSLRRLMRELALLRRSRGHSNVMEIRDLIVMTRTVNQGFLSKTAPRHVTDVYIVTELMMSDLGRMLDHHNSTLTLEQVRSLMFQFLLGLAHLHENGIMHRDIKPGNLLVDNLWRLKICDLGIARESSREKYVGSIYEDPDAMFTDYVVTRPYRAPELLMGSRSYDASVDMWSAGCVLAELLAGQEALEMAPLSRVTTQGRIRLPLFPGKDHKEMVKRIVAVLGHPTDPELQLLGKWEPKAVQFVEAQPYPHCDIETKTEVYGVESVGEHCTIPILAPCDAEEEACALDVLEQKPVEWGEVFPFADDEALQLLKKLLQYDPTQRPTAKEALAHAFFAKAAPPLKEGQRGADVDVDTAFKRDAVRSSKTIERQGYVQLAGSYNAFWEQCDESIWKTSD